MGLYWSDRSLSHGSAVLMDVTYWTLIFLVKPQLWAFAILIWDSAIHLESSPMGFLCSYGCFTYGPLLFLWSLTCGTQLFLMRPHLWDPFVLMWASQTSTVPMEACYGPVMFLGCIIYGSVLFLWRPHLCASAVPTQSSCMGLCFFLWRSHVWYLLFLWRPHVWACALLRRFSLMNIDCFPVVFQISWFLLESLTYGFLLVSPGPYVCSPHFPRTSSLMDLCCPRGRPHLWPSGVPTEGLTSGFLLFPYRASAAPMETLTAELLFL